MNVFQKPFQKTLKGQVEPITLILISGIIISLVGTVYLWGLPVIQKRTALSDFAAGKTFMLGLNDKIIGVANSGGGKQAVDIPNGYVKVIQYDANNPTDPNSNSVILEVFIDQPMIVLNQEIPIQSDTLEETGVLGQNDPWVFTVKEERFETQYKLTFKLHYRELVSGGDQPRGFRIGLLAADPTPGKEKVVVSFNNNIVDAGGASNSGDLYTVLVDIDAV